MCMLNNIGEDSQMRIYIQLILFLNCVKRSAVRLPGRLEI